MAKEKGAGSQGVSAHKSDWIDISYPLSQDMLYWPDDPVAPHIDWLYHPDKGQGRPISMVQLNINPHHGTHIDAPRHFFPDGTTIDEMPLEAIMGPARVIEIKDTVSIKPEELAAHNIQPGERILFKTINSPRYQMDKFFEDYVYLSTEGAHFLGDKKVSVVGLDYFAIGSYRDRENLAEVHRTLFSSGIWIIETINLSAVKAGRYEIICLPIKIAHGDAAPARAILRPV
jgi:arylformamidase